MSMHEIEDIVEQSVRSLDAAPPTTGPDVRTLLKNLYDFQSEYDTGFTHFRVIEILLKHRFAYVFDLADHPDYDRFGDRLDLEKNGAVLRDPTAPWDEVDNPRVGYACDPGAAWGAAHARRLPHALRRMRLYCDAGSELWRRFVAARVLVADDALEPRALPIEETVASVLRAAEASGNRELIGDWFVLFGYFPQAEMPANEAIRTLRTIARRAHVEDTATYVERGPSTGRGSRWFDLDGDDPDPRIEERAESRSWLVRQIAQKASSLSVEQIEAVLAALPDAVAAVLATEDRVTLPGVVELRVERKKGTPSRSGKNPFTGAKVSFPGAPPTCRVHATPAGELSACMTERARLGRSS